MAVAAAPSVPGTKCRASTVGKRQQLFNAVNDARLSSAACAQQRRQGMRTVNRSALLACGTRRNVVRKATQHAVAKQCESHALLVIQLLVIGDS